MRSEVRSDEGGRREGEREGRLTAMNARRCPHREITTTPTCLRGWEMMSTHGVTNSHGHQISLSIRACPVTPCTRRTIVRVSEFTCQGESRHCVPGKKVHSIPSTFQNKGRTTPQHHPPAQPTPHCDSPRDIAGARSWHIQFSPDEQTY